MASSHIIQSVTQSPEVKLSLVVGKEIQQAKKFPMNAPGRGDKPRGGKRHANPVCRIEKGGQVCGRFFFQLVTTHVARKCTLRENENVAARIIPVGQARHVPPADRCKSANPGAQGC